MYQAPQILPDLKRGEDSEWDDQPKRGGVRKVLGAAAAVVLVLGGGYLAWANRDSFGSFGGRGKASAVVATNSSAELGKRGDKPAPVAIADFDAATKEIDGRFQKSAFWPVVKKEFPEWYGEHLAEAAKLGMTMVFLSDRALPRRVPDDMQVIGVRTLQDVLQRTVGADASTEPSFKK